MRQKLPSMPLLAEAALAEAPPQGIQSQSSQQQRLQQPLEAQGVQANLALRHCPLLRPLVLIHLPLPPLPLWPPNL